MDDSGAPPSGGFDYRELAPPPELAGAVACVWTLRSAIALGTERVLPDGCVELVFHLGDRFQELTNGDAVAGGQAARLQPPELVVGPMTRHLLIAPTGVVDVVGLRLLPGAASGFLGVPMHILQDATYDLGAVGAPAFAGLRQRLGETPPGARAALAMAALRAAWRPERASPQVLAACALLARGEGGPSVESIAARVATAPRTLERLFLRHVGMSPKRLARLLRLQAVLRRVSAGEPATAATLARLPRAALDIGYYDQPHFLRDFRDIAGVSPSEFFRHESNAMSEAFTGGA